MIFGMCSLYQGSKGGSPEGDSRVRPEMGKDLGNGTTAAVFLLLKSIGFGSLLVLHRIVSFSVLSRLCVNTGF